MKIVFSNHATDDVARQFRYYLFEADSPTTAVHFQEAVEHATEELRRHPHLGVICSSLRYETMRSWPIVGFEVIRLYYVVESDEITIVRVLHGKRDVARILRNDLI